MVETASLTLSASRIFLSPPTITENLPQVKTNQTGIAKEQQQQYRKHLTIPENIPNRPMSKFSSLFCPIVGPGYGGEPFF